MLIVRILTGALAALSAAAPALAQTPDELSAPQLMAPGDFSAPAVRTASAAAGGAQGQDAAQSDSRPAPPGVGSTMMSQLPLDSTQVIVATGSDAESTEATLTLYEFADGSWQEVRSFEAHNGSNGWLKDRREGDKTSPVGVFALTDAGGYLKDPGSSLSYTQDADYRSSAQSVYGQDFARVFDYVIAVNYNRVAGTAPSDSERPEGWDKGGGIWLHVDHDSPTRGCVTIDREGMKFLLQTLDTAKKPHIIMGDQTSVTA